MKKFLGILVLGLLFCNVSFASDDDIVQQLKDLKELYDSGTLTEKEHTKAKKKQENASTRIQNASERI